MMPTNTQSRWSSPAQTVTILDTDGSALPSAIEATLTPEQLHVYALHFRICELTQQLQVPDTIVAQQQQRQRRRRSPSPDPEYDAFGRRTNTPVQRRRLALEAERHRCVEQITSQIPGYRPPRDYRRPTHFTARMYIPQMDYPHVNFIGQILGSRGKSLKAMEEESGAGMKIRGKGSVKEGRSARGRDGDSDEPLHLLLVANMQQKVEKAKTLARRVIDDAINKPDWLNERKQEQLRNVAVANGTFRDDEGRGLHRCITGMPTTQHMSAEKQPLGMHEPGSTDDPGEWEKEYQQLLEDIGEGKEADKQEQQQKFAKVPPWRLGRY